MIIISIIIISITIIIIIDFIITIILMIVTIIIISSNTSPSGSFVEIQLHEWVYHPCHYTASRQLLPKLTKRWLT